MLSRISIPIMYLCRSLHTGSVADGSSCSDGPVAVVFVVVVVVLVVDVVACVIDVVWPFWSLLLVCLLLSLFHGQIIRASTRICDPSYFKLLHFWALIIFQSSRVTAPTHPPVFIAPRILLFPKMGFLYINRRYLPIFDSFLLVVESNINRFWNGFHSRIAYSKLYNIAAQSLSRHKLRSMKIIIETFLGGNRFPCVSSVVFEANSVCISRDVLVCRTEQFDTTNDFLGRKLAKLENCIFRSARDRFSKRLLF